MTISCKACDQDEYFRTASYEAMDGAMPPALRHTCRAKGPRTRKQVLAQIAGTSKSLHTSFSSLMPGGDYYSREELDALEFRLAGGKL